MPAKLPPGIVEERTRKRQKDYVRRNSKRRAPYFHAYYIANMDRIKKRRAVYYQANKKRLNEKRREWEKKNRAVVKVARLLRITMSEARQRLERVMEKVA